MDILFIHGNYPGQFVHLARGLAAQQQHRVVFLTNRADPQVWPIPGVEVHRYELHRQVGPDTHSYLRSSEQAVLNGQAVARAIHGLVTGGLQPRLIIAHGGNGLQLFIRKVWPHGRLINYIEWYFNDSTNIFLSREYEINEQCRFSVRNWVILQELEGCDVAVTPTTWQWQQFPPHFRNKIKVIFDGVDTNFFKPKQITGKIALAGDGIPEPLLISPDDLLLSYATRGMEPLRGFPEFMRLLPPLLERYEKLMIVIAGSDRVAYSYCASAEQPSWKLKLLDELGAFRGRDRVHFVGSLNYGDYTTMLCRSDLHVYFSRPYVTSWGLFQAAACGSHLLVNRGPAIDYVFQGRLPLQVDMDDHSSVVCAAEGWLADALSRRSITRQSLLRPQWQLDRCLMEWQKLIGHQLKKDKLKSHSPA